MSILTIESSAPGPLAAHAGSFFQKRDLARTIEAGLSPEEHIPSALFLEFPSSNSAKLPADVRQAVGFVSCSAA